MYKFDGGGNNCFINVVLYTILNIEILAQYFYFNYHNILFNDNNHRLNSNKQHTNSNKYHISDNEQHKVNTEYHANIYIKLLVMLWICKRKYHNYFASHLKQLLRDNIYNSQSSQEDAYELLLYLLNFFVEIPTVNNINDNNSNNNINDNNSNNNINDNNTNCNNVNATVIPLPTFFKRLFSGMYQYIIRCTNKGCKSIIKKNIRHDIFSITVASIQQKVRNRKEYNNSNIDLVDIIRYNLHSERIDDYKCEKCNNIGNCIKQTKILHAPEILIIQLKRANTGHINTKCINTKCINAKRARNSNKYVIKNNDNININYSLHINNKKYVLYCIIFHISSYTTGGHYCCVLCKSAMRNEWYYCDDSYVKKININIDERGYIVSNLNLRYAYICIYINSRLII